MLSYSSERYYGRLGRPDDRWIPVKWNLNRIHIPPCYILYLPFDAASNGFLLKVSLSLPYGIFVPGGGGRGGRSYFPYILLNEIQTMFSQPANFETGQPLKLNQGEQIAMFLPRTKSRTSAEVKEEASEPRS